MLQADGQPGKKTSEDFVFGGGGKLKSLLRKAYPKKIEHQRQKYYTTGSW